MIRFALAIDPDLRAASKEREEGPAPVLIRNRARIASAKFQFEGTSSYPDATFTLRLSYGAVAGYEAGGPARRAGALCARPLRARDGRRAAIATFPIMPW